MRPDDHNPGEIWPKTLKSLVAVWTTRSRELRTRMIPRFWDGTLPEPLIHTRCNCYAQPWKKPFQQKDSEPGSKTSTILSKNCNDVHLYADVEKSPFVRTAKRFGATGDRQLAVVVNVGHPHPPGQTTSRERCPAQ